jgi:hypothetical protein
MSCCSEGRTEGRGLKRSSAASRNIVDRVTQLQTKARLHIRIGRVSSPLPSALSPRFKSLDHGA